MGYRLNRLDEPVFMAVSKLLLTEFGIYYRLESCEQRNQFFAFIDTFTFLQAWKLVELEVSSWHVQSCE